MSRTRLAPLLLVVATFLAVGCKPAAHKMGAALPTAPPIFQIIPAGADPNTLKIPGAQGTVLQNSGGVGSWVMDSTGTWVTNPPTGGGTPDGGYTLASLAAQAPSTVVGVAVDGGTVPPSALTQAQLTALLNPATSSLPGAMTAALASSLASVAAGAHVPVTFDSRDWNGGATLNLLTTTSNYKLTATLPGYYCVPLGGSAAFKFVVTAATGSTPVASTGNYGNNSTTRNNMTASGAGVPIANTGFALGAPYVVNMTVASVPGPLADLATPIGLDVTVAGTTATTWAGYVLTNCYLYVH